MRKYDEVQELIKRLRNTKVTLGHGEYGVDPLFEQSAKELEDQLDLIEKQQKIIRRVYVDHFPNTWFPTGEIGETDSNGLPEYIEVCPAYGVGFTVLYKKTDRTISMEGS